MKDEALRMALEALESCDSNMDNIDQRFNAGKVESAITAIKQALAAQQEPLEYWNAVEGWVKIDEVREHFDSVGCGTIYKTAGDGRVPLTAAQRTWVGLTDEDIEQEFGFIDELLRDCVHRTEAKLKEKNI
jgi:hypothetical protein